MSYESVMERVDAAAQTAGRDVTDVTVVAVSKTKTTLDIRRVYDMGHRDFGENRADELARKAPELPDDIRWHFVGSLQSRKTRMVRPVAHLLHSMDRASLAGAWLKGPGMAPPVLLQVNVGSEEQKSGVDPDHVGETLEQFVRLGLDVRGLMAIPPIPGRPEDSAPYFHTLRSLRDEAMTDHPELTELSMGMTDDFEVAIEEGASIIRVGRAIFGPRN